MLNGFELAKLGGQFLVFLRLARLLAQIRQLSADLADHVPEAFEIGFGRLETHFRLVTAAIEARDAGRVLQDAAALLRLGIDELADLPLLDQRPAARAGGGVGEQNLHVLGARFLAVDLVNGAGLALDAARDFQHVVVVEGGGGGALRVVDRNHHLGHVARRALIRAGEDHVVHGGGAHALVGGLAHHPAKRLQEVRLAAAVRPHDARKPRPDDKLGRLDEGFETEKP